MPDPNEELLAAITRMHMSASGLRASADEMQRFSQYAAHATPRAPQHDPSVVDMVRGADGVWRAAL